MGGKGSGRLNKTDSIIKSQLQRQSPITKDSGGEPIFLPNHSGISSHPEALIENWKTNFTAGSIPFSNGTYLVEDNNNLFWNNVNKRLALNHNNPSVSLHLQGTNEDVWVISTLYDPEFILGHGTSTGQFGGINWNKANKRLQILTQGNLNQLVLDQANGWTRIGGSSDYAEISSTGDTVFVGGGGLCFGEIYCNDAASTITITASGQANKVQITSFDTNGASNNTSVDNTNDHITITKAGHYMCNVSIACASAAAGGSDRFGFAVYKNNGATEFANLHSHRKLSGGGGDYGSISMSGIIDVAVNDTIEVWVWNEDNTDNLVIDDITLSLIQIGGT